VSAVTVRRIEARDEPRWRDLWDGYCRFYERSPNAPVADYTWSRIMDPAAAVYAIVAEREGEGVLGIANYLLHENTATLAPVCYLQDLYVDPECRAEGVGKALIDWLVSEMQARGWARLYWNTRATNYRARGLYDKYAQESGFVRYVVQNPAAS
jgi:ribosomal protein S18 acetylase RimI-like enzyme